MRNCWIFILLDGGNQKYFRNNVFGLLGNIPAIKFFLMKTLSVASEDPVYLH